jgi:glycosyltransferase involved in cell wall biosynthesis
VKKFRIGIDAVGAKHSGAMTILCAVVKAALRNPRIAKVYVFTSPRHMRDFSLECSGRCEEIQVLEAERGAFSRFLWHLRGLPAQASELDLDGLICLSGGGSGTAANNSILFIQQALPFSSEALATLDFMNRVRTVGIRIDMWLSSRRSRLVVVQSRTMKHWVCERLGLRRDKVVVVEPDAFLPSSPQAPPVELEEMRAAPLGRVLLYVGSAASYKNLAVLEPAMKLLREVVPDAVLFGTFPSPGVCSIERGIFGLPQLSQSVLREAYRLATVVVMPSLVETVGLPLLEATLEGAVVVAADRPYAHDICGDTAVYFDPHDAHELANSIASVLQDDSRRKALVERATVRLAARTAARPYDRMINLLFETTYAGHL